MGSKTTNIRSTLLQIVDSSLTLSTREVLRDICFAAIHTSDLEDALSRFQVHSITHCKDALRMPHHELLLIELTDTSAELGGTERFLMILERTESSIRSDIPRRLFQATALSSLSSPRELLGYQSLNNSASASTASLSLADAATMALSAAACASTPQSSPTYFANDTVRGGRNVELYANSVRNVRQILPLGLSFFELVVLADSLHEQEPNYTALGKQCFWFASTICQVVEQEYGCDEVVTGPSSSSKERIHANDYLPDISGRVGGLLVSRPEISPGLVANFREHLNTKREEVSSNSIRPELLFLKRRYRCRRTGTAFVRMKGL
jgi:hypothetical protein